MKEKSHDSELRITKKYNLCFLLIFLFFMNFAILCAQNKVVSGRVIDKKSQEPIIGAVVKEANASTNGTITDLDGLFSVTVPENSTLEVSLIGYKTEKVPVAGKTKLEVLLEEDEKILDEVVVVGYGTQSRRNVTGAVSDIKSDDLTRTAYTTMAGSLSGKMPGISVRTANARHGYGASLEIRNLVIHWLLLMV